MKRNDSIVELVNESKKDMQAANNFIVAYMPYIKSETSKFMNRAPIEGQDEELSIAMIAFHEAIQSYSEKRGSFLTFASLLIKNRLIDFWRKNKRHSATLSIDTPIYGEDEEGTIADTLTDGNNPHDTHLVRKATREEIEELTNQLTDFGVSLTDVAENSPKQKRTLDACRDALSYAKKDSKIMATFLRTKRLPLSKIARGSKVEKKTLERHRKYLVALLLIYSNGYEIIRGHLSQVLKGENA